jgi:tripartite-type tricarboxylate transporter receptor subunit TctC
MTQRPDNKPLRVCAEERPCIFTAPGVTPEQVAFYVDLFKKVLATDDWKKFMSDGAYNQTFMSGDEFKSWVDATEKRHYELMKEANFLAAKQ